MQGTWRKGMKIHNYLKAPLKGEIIHGGEGLCPHATIFPGGEIDAPVQFINYTVIPPGCSFGVHEHGNNNDFYVVMAGHGVYTQDGEEAAVEAGDIIMNAPFASHAIRNTGDTDMPLLVFEVDAG
jgi:mannose-6-phosphate isomerase-like protein (cupin superfamily)